MTGFPESFQRSTVTPSSSYDTESTAAMLIGIGEPSGSTAVSMSVERGRECIPVPSTRRVSRSSMMRLENILNDVSINHDPAPTSRPPRSRSLGSVHSNRQDAIDIFSPPSPGSATSAPGRSQSPEDDIWKTTAAGTTVKKKKVKMHRCSECQKDFPRPSGLRTHMNMHTKEKPFACTYPGCLRSFSVVSNARRHMRTHGVGVTTEDVEQPPVPYVVGFEDPMVLDQPDSLGIPGYSPSRSHPFRLRWIPLTTSTPKSDKRQDRHSPDILYSNSGVQSKG
uniref:C2H2-type domain-containing protein n=1 Tax=Psilocybe cubensis TaxID=181762 RepID=A0A8H7XQW8_PSICU